MEVWLRNFTWFTLTLVLVPVLVGGIGYYVLRAYEATATIWVEPQATQSAGDPWKPKTAADIYAGRLGQLLLTRSFRKDVLRNVAAKTGLVIDGNIRHEALLKTIERNAKVVARGPYLVEIRYRDEDRAIAREMASAIVDGFQRETVSLKSEAARRLAELYEQQMQQVRDEIAMADQPTVDPRELQSRIDLLRTLEERRNEFYGYSVASTLAVPATIFVIDEANVPDRRSTNWAQLLLTTMAALVVTIVAELGVLIILTLGDRTIHSAADIEGLAPVPAVDMTRV